MGPLALTLSLLHSDLVDGMSKWIRSVSFSPDSKLLATGADNGVIRVSSRIFILAIVIVAIIVFEVNAQHRMIFGALDLGHRQEPNSQQPPGSHRAGLLARFLVGRQIARLRVTR